MSTLLALAEITKVINQSFLLYFQLPPPRLELPPEESTDLEELEQFAKMFKQKRIKLGKATVVATRGNQNSSSLFVETSILKVCLFYSQDTHKAMWAWPWAKCTATTFLKPPSRGLRPSTCHSRTCAN